MPQMILNDLLTFLNSNKLCGNMSKYGIQADLNEFGQIDKNGGLPGPSLCAKNEAGYLE